jgi:hypothetical protein
LEKVRSIFIASSASLILRENDSSLVNRKFLATCWVMVEAPCGRRPLPYCCTNSTAARAMPEKSMPPCS